MNSTYEGVVVKVKRVFFKDTEPAQAHIKAFVDRFATRADCPECGGTAWPKRPETPSSQERPSPNAARGNSQHYALGSLASRIRA